MYILSILCSTTKNSKFRIFFIPAARPTILASLDPRWRQKIGNCCQSTFSFAFQLIFCDDKKQIGNARLGLDCCEKPRPSHLLHQRKIIIHHPSKKSQEVNQKPKRTSSYFLYPRNVPQVEVNGSSKDASHQTNTYI